MASCDGPAVLGAGWIGGIVGAAVSGESSPSKSSNSLTSPDSKSVGLIMVMSGAAAAIARLIGRGWGRCFCFTGLGG